MVKIIAIRPYCLRGARVEKGEIVDVEDDVALSILNCGKAEPADESTKLRFTQRSVPQCGDPPDGRIATWTQYW